MAIRIVRLGTARWTKFAKSYRREMAEPERARLLAEHGARIAG